MTILEQMGASAKQAARVLMNAGAKKEAALYAIAEAAYRDGLGREGESVPNGSDAAAPLPSALRFFDDLKRLAGPAGR